MVLLKEALKARVTAYNKTVEEAAQAAVVKAAAAEAAPAEGALAEPVVIESDNSGGADNDEDAAFKVEDKVTKETIQEAKRFRVNLVRLIKPYFIALALTYR